MVLRVYASLSFSLAWYSDQVKIRSILFLPLAAMVLSCASSQRATPVPGRPAIQTSTDAESQTLQERLEASPAWKEDSKGEFLALLGDFLGPDYKVTVDAFRWEPGSGEGSGLRIAASAPASILQGLHFEEFSIGETDLGFEFTGKVHGGSLYVELIEDRTTNQISVAIGAEDMLAPESIDFALGKYSLAGDLSFDLDLVLVAGASTDRTSRRWQLGNAEVGMITSKSGLTIVQPEPGSSMPLGRPALIATWDSAKRRLQVGGGFKGEGRMTALTAVSATYDAAADSFRLAGKVDTARPEGSYELSGSILDPVMTAFPKSP
jgi:hypothetical protein